MAGLGEVWNFSEEIWKVPCSGKISNVFTLKSSLYPNCEPFTTDAPASLTPQVTGLTGLLQLTAPKSLPSLLPQLTFIAPHDTLSPANTFNSSIPLSLSHATCKKS